MKLFELLQIEKGVTAIIGSGGKTTMLCCLARELSRLGRVLLCTSTHILPPEAFPCLLSPTEAEIRQALSLSPAVCVGRLQPNGKLTACGIAYSTLAELADYVLVEADGSKRLPLKAHESHEPVIPAEAGKTICVVGASGFGQPIAKVVHRIERFCLLSGAAPEALATPKLVAKVLQAEALADVYYVNQCDVLSDAHEVKCLAELLPQPVFFGSLKQFLD